MHPSIFGSMNQTIPPQNDRHCPATTTTEKKGTIKSQEIMAAQGRIRNLAEQLKRKEESIKSMELHYETELKKCKESQRKVAEMAGQLKYKSDDLKERSLALDKRMAECDALERQLQQWQRELEGEGGTAVSPGGSDFSNYFSSSDAI